MCKCTTLDEFVGQKGITKIDFIKIDVAGAEAMCLDGGKETIGAFKPILTIEVNAEGLLHYGCSADSLFRSIKRFGCKTYEVKSSDCGFARGYRLRGGTIICFASLKSIKWVDIVNLCRLCTVRFR